jgi:hypothetical protein
MAKFQVSINIPRKSHRDRSKSPGQQAIRPPPSEAARAAGIITAPQPGTESILPRINAPGKANPNWIQF